MKRNTFITLFLTILILTIGGCKKNKSFEEKYVGAWDITFDGSFSGEKTVIIKSDGTFSFSIVLSQGLFGSTTNTFTGNVNEKGMIEGDIFMSGDDIGDVTGTLDENGIGEGVYITDVPTSGTWIAVKL